MHLLHGKGYEEIQEINSALLEKGSFAIDGGGMQLDKSIMGSLSKALSAGEGVGTAMVDLSQLTGGRAITVENIDTVLKNTAERKDDLVWYKLLRNKPIYAVLDQYMVMSDLGLNEYGRVFGKYTSESAFPKASDITLERKVDVTKFIRDMRDLTHVMDNVSTYTEQKALLDLAGAITVLTGTEISTGFGNTEANPYEPDGLYTKLLYGASVAGGSFDTIIDCRKTGGSSGSKGGQIVEEQLDDGARKIMNSFGRATNLVMATHTKADINQVLPTQRRVFLGQNKLSQQMLGMPAVGFVSDFASGWADGSDPHFKFNPSIDSYFPNGESKSRKAPIAAFPNTTDAPLAATGVAVATTSDVLSKFGAGDAGEYWYKVSAFNSNGMAVSVAPNATLAIASGGKGTITVTCNDSTITGLAIYRSAMDADASDCRWIADVKCDDPVGDTVVTDLNNILPGTSVAFLISNNPLTDAIDYRQLMPFVKMELPFGLNQIVGRPFLYMLYQYMRTPKLFNPRTGGSYHMMFTNIRWTQSQF